MIWRFRPPFLELQFYSLIFLSTIFYAIFRFYKISIVYINYIDLNDLQYNNLLTPWIKHRLDVTDLEWQIVKQFYFKNKFWFLVLHSIGFLTIRLSIPKYLCHFIIAYSTVTLGYLLSVKYLALIYLNITFIFLLEFINKIFFSNSSFLSRIPHYIVFIYSIAVIHNIDFIVDGDRGQNLLIHVSFSWLNAKLLSCSIDFYEKLPSSTNILTRLAYLLYFPPFFFGPIYQYSDFEKAINLLENHSSFKIELWFKNILQLFRFIFWACVLEFILHFIYSSAFLYYVYLIENFDHWALCGFGYSLMILFYLKYFVIYGLSRQWAIVDGLDHVISRPPECIAHVYQTSYLWRQFDRGLYLFLLKYFYKPLINCSHLKNFPRKLLATLLSFTVIAFWHGYYDAILVWVTMNIILSISESLGSKIFQNDLMKNSKRIQALFAAPYLALAYVSNIFFLSNYEIGMLFLKKFIFGFPFPFLQLFAILYCICFVCQHINESIQLN